MKSLSAIAESPSFFSRTLTTPKYQVALVLLLFTLTTVFLHRHAVGEDLGSSYVGCRLVAAGQASHLYSHSVTIFSNVPDPLWKSIGRAAHFAPLGLLHPYVQTPLWAYSLQPLCTRMDFRAFFFIFLVLASAAMAATIWLAARYWAPRLFAPVPIAILCAVLSISEPFRYAMFLLQTHVFFLLLSVLALMLAERKRPVLAGILLALAAAVKITPGFLIVYWLMTRRRKAAGSFVAASVLLLAMTYLIAGPALFGAYLRELSETSKVLLVSFNVQSLAAWLTAWHFGAWEQLDWKTHSLPFFLRALSLLCTLASAAAGGWMDRRAADAGSQAPPYGAVFTLIGVTIFTPIAWNHYFILMVLPVLVLLNEKRRDQTAQGSVRIALVVAIVVLNLYPVRFSIEHHLLGPIALIRTQWYSGVLALVALWMASQRSLTDTALKASSSFRKLPALQ